MAHPYRAKSASMTAAKIKGYASGGRTTGRTGTPLEYQAEREGSGKEDINSSISGEKAYERGYQRDDGTPTERFRFDQQPFEGLTDFSEKQKSKRGGRV